MPPKRKPPATASSSSKQPPKRRSKLAKENNLSAAEEDEIREAFSLFAVQPSGDSSDPVLAAADVRRCLIALNAPPKDAAELREILVAVDPEDSGWAEWEHFVAVAALKLHARHDDDDAGREEEVARAFGLFTRGQDREIGLADLRRVARELREDVPELVLKDMIREATGGGLGGVGLEEFEGVMRRAGVFG